MIPPQSFTKFILHSSIFSHGSPLLAVPNYRLAYLLLGSSRCHYDLRNYVATKPFVTVVETSLAIPRHFS